MFKCFQTGNILRFNQNKTRGLLYKMTVFMQNEYLTSAQREYIMDFMKPKSDTRCRPIVYYKGTQNKYESALKVYERSTTGL